MSEINALRLSNSSMPISPPNQAAAVPDIDLNAIAKVAGFPAAFDLGLYAISVLPAFWHVRQRDLRVLWARKNGSSLERLASRAEALAHDLQTFGPRLEAVVAACEPDLSQQFLAELPSNLLRWASAVRDTVSDAQTGQRGAPPEPGFTFAIRELYSVFRDHFPDEVGYFRKFEAEHGYDGRFFHLVRLLVAELGIQKTPLAIGKAIDRSLKNYEP